MKTKPKFLGAVAIIAVLLGVILMARSCRADEHIPQHLVDALVKRRDAIKEWALVCPEGSPYAGQYTIYDNVCWQGDMTCYSGLCCLAARLAGDEETADARCGDVAKAQGPSGRWYRGPMFVGQNYGAGQDPDPADFSRDQTRGVFAYLIADGYLSPDPGKYRRAVEAAESWLTWMESNNEKTCLEDSRTCELTVSTHNAFFNVYRHLGVLPRKSESRLARKFHRSKWYYRFGFLAETRALFLDETLRDKWYPRHLKMQTCLLYRVMNMDFQDKEARERPWVRNKRAARVLGKAARRIWKGDPTNPFYRLMYQGVTTDLVEQVLSKYTQAEKTVPQEGRMHDWFLQRHTSEEAWTRSDGHDSVFLINLMLARIYGRLVW